MNVFDTAPWQSGLRMWAEGVFDELFLSSCQTWPCCAGPRLDCVHWPLHSDALVSHKFLQQHLITADPAHSETGKNLSSCLIHTHTSSLNCHNLSKFKRQKLLRSSAFLRFFLFARLCLMRSGLFESCELSDFFEENGWIGLHTHTLTHVHIHKYTLPIRNPHIHANIHISMIQWFYMYSAHERCNIPTCFSPLPPFALQHSSFTDFPTWNIFPTCVRTSAFDKGMQLFFALVMFLGVKQPLKQAALASIIGGLHLKLCMWGWSMLLLGLFMMMGALFMGNLHGHPAI